MQKFVASVIALLVCAWIGIEPVAAQPVGLDPNRDCQTILTCNYARGGIYRGCLSSYSCRVCRLVAAPCRLDVGRRVCQEMRCRWG